MSALQKNINLLPYNTLRVSALADYFLALHSKDDLPELPKEKTLILGEGANILFLGDFPGLVIKNEIKGIKVVKETDKEVVLEIGAGENWHELVMYTVKNGWSGMENLALIPGTVGAAPVQNLAAYGQNFEDVCVSLEGFSLDNGSKQLLNKVDCKLGYRDSVFKHNLENKFLITKVTIKLFKSPHFDLAYHSRYESLASVLPNHPDIPYTPKEIAQAVTSLRQQKLPDWTKTGTAGSFFKNPNVSWERYQKLSQKIPNLQHYPTEKLSYLPTTLTTLNSPDRLVKIPAGRLLDELGWRGKRIGNVGTWPKHASTVINYGGATGREIYDFAKAMHADVQKNYGVDLEYEVNLVS